MSTATTNTFNLLRTLEAYGFEGLDEFTPNLLKEWSKEYPETWPVLAMVEAIHQGRYKLLSIQQILRCWQRRGTPRTNFDRTFQRQILDEVWQPLVLVAPPVVVEPPQPHVPELPCWPEQAVVHRLRELVGVA